jgi:hypothetical protein
MRGETLGLRFPFRSASDPHLMEKQGSRLFEYYQDVLGRISFADRVTFRKELRKAFRRLLPEERDALKQWFRTACLCRPMAVRKPPTAGTERVNGRC